MCGIKWVGVDYLVHERMIGNINNAKGDTKWELPTYIKVAQEWQAKQLAVAISYEHIFQLTG